MEAIIAFFNSGFFVAFATMVTGGVAILLFFGQKQDAKNKAAIIILLEIRNAEDKIDEIREKVKGGTISGDLPSVLPVNSWKNYAHLFAKDFDQDELRLMNSFFSKCAVIEDYANRNNSFFWTAAEERTKVVQRKLADLIEKANGNAATLTQLKSTVLDSYTNDNYQYAPQKTAQVIEFNLQNFPKITPTTCGEKLKKIAKV